MRRTPPTPPRTWLFTDTARMPDPAAAVARLPAGSGVIFRDYERADREALGRDLRRICRARRILFLVAGDAALALRLKADGVHLPEHASARAAGIRRMRKGWLITAAAHGKAAIRAAGAADLIFLSPVFPTRSHPGAPVLGPLRFARMARGARKPVAALGGINAATSRRLKGSGAHGWAAIGAFL